MNAILTLYSADVIIFLLAGIIVIVLLFGFIIYFVNSYRSKKKDFALLEAQKQEIDHQKAILEKTLTELKAAQSQLIQAEKMASLGELTAGIAHEIQNPLNFVNNFSEVNKEMLEELKVERNKPDTVRNRNLEDNIINEVIENSLRINSHGKRADAIVKGMLQHSRTNSGNTESTNINALADEYLRLAYHGLKAKDKSFNVTMKTDFDESLSMNATGDRKINVIPQDIGRVILNLISNAFYAVDEKKKSGIENYEPMVSITTKKLNNSIEIKVTDNGNGIRQEILNKIFQPFFTTKPTGQGTGLGLSLSYDIVKAHGGEIIVETLSTEEIAHTQEDVESSKDGQSGTSFIIKIPIN